MSRILYKFFFSLAGWKIKGGKPQEKKFVIVVAPHTSNIDFFIGLAARSILRLNSAYLAKKQLFDLPLIGWVFKALGGIPVDRSKKSNMVEQVAEFIREAAPDEEVAVCVTPEGTRSYAVKWKTGFWHIADYARIPIVMVGFDYKTKTVTFKEPFYTTDKEKDMEKMKAYFRTVTGKHPEKGVK